MIQHRYELEIYDPLTNHWVTATDDTHGIPQLLDTYEEAMAIQELIEETEEAIAAHNHEPLIPKEIRIREITIH